MAACPGLPLLLSDLQSGQTRSRWQMVWDRREDPQGLAAHERLCPPGQAKVAPYGWAAVSLEPMPGRPAGLELHSDQDDRGLCVLCAAGQASQLVRPASALGSALPRKPQSVRHWSLAFPSWAVAWSLWGFSALWQMFLILPSWTHFLLCHSTVWAVRSSTCRPSSSHVRVWGPSHSRSASTITACSCCLNFYLQEPPFSCNTYLYLWSPAR